MRADMWLPQDNWSIDANGSLVGKDGRMKSPEGPIGLGFYRRVSLYTDGKFIIYELHGGPPVSGKKAEEGKGPGD